MLQNILTGHWHQYGIFWYILNKNFPILLLSILRGESVLQTNASESLCPLHDPRIRKCYRCSSSCYPNFDRKGRPNRNLGSCLPCILTGHFVFWTLAHVFIRKRGRTINESFARYSKKCSPCRFFGNHGRIFHVLYFYNEILHARNGINRFLCRTNN